MALGHPTVSHADEVRRMVSGRLWQVGDGSLSALHPWLRRLLLLRLCGRPDSDEHSWTAVHGRLRDACRAEDDRVGLWYHALALGEVDKVVAGLDAALDDVAGTDWLIQLREVASAPRREMTALEPDGLRGAGLAGAAGLASSLLAPGDRSPASAASARAAVVERLVVTLWQVSEPLLGIDTGRLRACANHLTELGSIVAHLSEPLFAMADHYRKEAQRYDG